MVTKLNRSDSISILRDIVGSENESNLNNLAELLGDIPLALVQAGAYIRKSQLEIEDYIRLYLSKRKQLWSKEAQLKSEANDLLVGMDDYKNTVTTAISLSIKDLRAKSKEAYDLLGVMSFLYNEGIKKEILDKYLSVYSVKLNEVMPYLNMYSLLENATDDKAAISIHEIVQVVIMDQLGEKEKEKYLNSAAEIINSYLPNQLDMIAKLMEGDPSLYLHLSKIKTSFEKLELINEKSVKVKQNLLEYVLPALRDYTVAEMLINNIEDDMHRGASSVSDLIKMRFHVMRSAFMMWSKLDNLTALEEAHQAEEYIKIYPEHLEEHLMVYNILVHIYVHIGKLHQAKKYSDIGFNVVQEARRREMYIGNLDSFYQARAKVFLDEGDYEGALINSSQAVQEVKKIETNKGIAGLLPIYIFHNYVMLSGGGSADAFAIAERNLNIAKEIFQEEHYFKSVAYIVAAQAALLNGDIGKTEKDVNKGLEFFTNKKRMKNKSRFMAKAYYIKGKVSEEMGKNQEALDNYFRSLSIYKEMFQEESKIEDISKLYTNLVKCSVKLKDDSLAYKYYKLHKNIFGIKHTRTIYLTEFLIKNDLKKMKR